MYYVLFEIKSQYVFMERATFIWIALSSIKLVVKRWCIGMRILCYKFIAAQIASSNEDGDNVSKRIKHVKYIF